MKINRERALKRKKIIFGSMFVISSLLIMIAVSFSWFYNGKTATVSGITVDVTPADNLMVKFSSDTDWKKKIHLNFPDTPMKPVSGDGSQFFDSVLGRNSATEILEVQDFEAIKDIESYGIFEAHFSMLVENQNHLKLAKTSSLTPAEGDIVYPYEGVDAGQICAAMRVAFMVKEEDAYRLVSVWIPNAQTEITPNGEGGLIINESGAVEETYKFRSSTDEEPILIETEGKAFGVKEIEGVRYVWGNLEEDIIICEMQPNTPIDLKLVIWLDGEDRECRNEMIGGQVAAIFDFTVDDEKESETE